MDKASRFYSRAFKVTYAILNFFFRYRFIGKENIPEGAAIVCANHTSFNDAFFLAHTFDPYTRLHIMGKAELFSLPLLSRLLLFLGMIPVDRENADINSVKMTLTYLRAGEKVAIFPQGTRVDSDDAVAAKSGAVRISVKAGVPILPVFIPRKKRIFKKTIIVIGQPYMVAEKGEKLSQTESSERAEAIMSKIWALEEQAIAYEG